MPFSVNGSASVADQSAVCSATTSEPDEAEIARMVEEERTVREAVASAKKGEAIVKEHLIRARRDRSISATPLEL